uniref:tRNA (guanine(26)-N(2))-dimethyltransferase n=1 Tax=Paramoeba aestuarina TaxID=180227 RepID=A0A7S4PCC0_9EUKA|eukprot:CAMPEP_0201530044 /NCGR_PEP_ID=MMETSP0161_2-20130828/43558_1 /ASSEMBLY_ACC=CAM_ASM_000251 /TAXON_ID=180227 /ORGANISM="Neoparamoeba aestuarina, Strain SoJaBio B1-5/56/2" /LENGTH=524 /DNA_ID=CAMNT_0047932177 /DNA_START=57 /DNA_END=1631 /DNA_ORIENTATION=+
MSSSSPKVVEGFPHSVTENSATIYYRDKNEVFYNPVQESNRDLSICVMKNFIALRQKEWDEKQNKRIAKNPDATPYPLRKPRVLEALSATGLRSIRFCKEIVSETGEPLLGSVLVNDLEQAAYESIQRNLEHNDVPKDLGIANLGDATQVMYNHRDKDNQFDIIDLDPYGSAGIFLDGAVQSVSDGGLLSVTCTDLKVLCGNHPEVCFSKYGAMPLRGKMSHEMAVRLVLKTLEAHANLYKRHIVPLVSMYIDFYVRVFVRVFTSPATVKEAPAKISHVFQCTGCTSLHFNPIGKVTPTKDTPKISVSLGPPVGSHCAECGSRFRMGGPIWTHPTVNEDFLKGVLAEMEGHKEKYGHHKRMIGKLKSLQDELHTAPLFHTCGEIANVLHCTTPATAVVTSALKKKGYQVTASHSEPGAIKTDAPVSLIWDFFRCWVKQNPVTRKMADDSPAARILSKEPKEILELGVDEEEKEKKKKRKTEPGRFLPNPREGWGPGSRAHCGKKRKIDEEEGKGKEESAPMEEE